MKYQSDTRDPEVWDPIALVSGQKEMDHEGVE